MTVDRPFLRRVAAATGLLVAAWAAPARGDTCSDCGPPSDAAFREAIGSALVATGDSPDYYEYEGGPCTAVVGPVSCRMASEECLVAGHGVARSCPDGGGVCRVNYTLQITPEYEWTLTSGAGGDLGAALVAKMAAGAEAAGCPASGAAKALTIDTLVEAAWCQVAPWTAMFFVATYEASAEYSITRSFTWWVRNPATEPQILATGTLEHLCESGTATMKRRWPVEGLVDAYTDPCKGDCTPSGTGGVRLTPYEPEGGGEPKPAPTDDGGTTSSTPTEPEDGGSDGGSDGGTTTAPEDEPTDPEDDPYPTNPADGTDSSPYPADPAP